jgi:hypothetical protein
MLDLTQHATDGIHRGIDMNGYVTLEDRGIGTPRIPMDNQTYTSVIFVIARICNQAGAMDTSRQITLRISNGNYSTAVSTYVQLQQRGCSDVTIGFGNLNLNLTGAVYLLYGEVDLYNNVSETREDNNTSYWRLRVQ